MSTHPKARDGTHRSAVHTGGGSPLSSWYERSCISWNKKHSCGSNDETTIGFNARGKTNCAELIEDDKRLKSTEDSRKSSMSLEAT